MRASGDKFDTSWQDSERRGRHGMSWEKFELRNLEKLFLEGCTLKQICEDMRRPAADVLTKLSQMGLLRFDVLTCNYIVTNPRSSTSTKEITMNITGPITIENHTTINGIEISQLSDGQLYSLIASQEAEIERLSRIKNQPQRLRNDLAKREAGIKALVELLDSREAS